MIEIKGNLFDYAGLVDWLCITTNCEVDRNGDAIMGKGCALEAKKRWPGIERVLGREIISKPHMIEMPTMLGTVGKTKIWSLPTKYKWREKSNLNLIIASVQDLYDAAGPDDYPQDIEILLPRPGCSNGGLSWENEVRPRLAAMLDDRFKIISND